MRTLILFLAATALLSACNRPPVNRAGEAPPQTEASVDLNRYQGLWYEIARFPNSFEEGCEGVTAAYALREDGKVDVTNTCRQGTVDGPEEIAQGIARVVDGSSNSKLKVKFAPAWVPFASGDYWILYLDPAYETVLVGSPDGRYLWILARTPQISALKLEEMRTAASQRGYDTAALRMTEQPPA
ncbi:lipocalin family protein [Aquisalinus flavus]|uniref:Outer membrane lipoprotein Blc n=1 Tax=Aquisalinus flavus TaxID=1526572 RepID=A0A8J2V2A2_9PROT|nr:lipocalin family protein [Aquisalinus flavus]MBD0427205.1 lipocalin family protein [Aquisalinus flavus]UNE47020.1 lipocalin family protein [Aquisalinus flavus]GGC99153.1 lipocalin [Aquisalinus flavus]